MRATLLHYLRRQRMPQCIACGMIAEKTQDFRRSVKFLVSQPHCIFLLRYADFMPYRYGAVGIIAMAYPRRLFESHHIASPLERTFASEHTGCPRLGMMASASSAGPAPSLFDQQMAIRSDHKCEAGRWEARCPEGSLMGLVPEKGCLEAGCVELSAVEGSPTFIRVSGT